MYQDDGATIHRTNLAEGAVKELFKSRISTKVQAPKMDDLWPSEVPWAILDEKIRQKKDRIKTKHGLKRVITNAWRSITSEQCKALIEAVPKRLKTIQQSGGERLLGRRVEDA